MAKVIRSTYPLGFSVGVLLLIFVISFFLSHQIFDTPLHDLDENPKVYFGMFLASMAVIIMVLIIWEEILFPVKLKEIEGGKIFRNHSTKLKTQLLIYCSIPAIFIFIYLDYDVKIVRFILWTAVCTIAPILEKIFSGINNYNDFLKLTDETIEYRNNEKQGSYPVKEIQGITILKDTEDLTHKIQLTLVNKENVIIDLDEMELEAFYYHIYVYINSHYENLLKTKDMG